MTDDYAAHETAHVEFCRESLLNQIAAVNKLRLDPTPGRVETLRGQDPTGKMRALELQLGECANESMTGWDVTFTALADGDIQVLSSLGDSPEMSATNALKYLENELSLVNIQAAAHQMLDSMEISTEGNNS